MSPTDSMIESPSAAPAASALNAGTLSWSRMMETPTSLSVAGPVTAIGSGGPFALAAARALIAHSDLAPRAIAEEAMKIAAAICIYTNEHITIEALDS